MSPEGRVISLSGVIDKRKGADILAGAFAQAIRNGLDDATLLLAGPHYDDIKGALAAPEVRTLLDTGRILSIDRLLDEQDMYCAAAASDLVAAPYPNHSGRSSIILWAAAAGTPVLATHRGCIGHVVETENLGLTCDVSDPEELAAAIEAGLNQPWTTSDRERALRYGKQHTVDNYRELNARLVMRRISSEPSDRDAARVPPRRPTI